MNGVSLLDQLAIDGAIDMYAANPRYFVTANPQGSFSGVTRRRLRMYPAMSEETAFSLPGWLGPHEQLNSPNSPRKVATGLAGRKSDPREWLA